jgi:hypothetical protein
VKTYCKSSTHKAKFVCCLLTIHFTTTEELVVVVVVVLLVVLLLLLLILQQLFVLFCFCFVIMMDAKMEMGCATF